MTKKPHVTVLHRKSLTYVAQREEPVGRMCEVELAGRVASVQGVGRTQDLGQSRLYYASPFSI